MRQKENLKAKKEVGGEVKKPKQIVEAHNDDCGMDLSGIEASVANYEQKADGEWFFAALQDDESEAMSQWLSSRHWLFGSESDETARTNPRSINCSGMEAFYKLATRPASYFGQVDVVEIFGGEAGTSQVLVRRFNTSVGPNFDLTCGFNPRDSRHIELLFQYFEFCKPTVVDMAPPCTGLKGWAGINAVVNPQGHQQSVENSEAMGRLAAKIAILQLNAGRHFIVENPEGSALWELSDWKRLRAHVARVRFDQVQLGLRRRLSPRLPINKATELWASCPALIRRLADHNCDRQHQHAIVGNDTKRGVAAPSKEAQVWPDAMCRKLAAGIQEVLQEKSEKKKHSAFPAVKASPGMPNAKSGIMAAGGTALFAASDAIKPSGEPLPNSSGVFDVFCA